MFRLVKLAYRSTVIKDSDGNFMRHEDGSFTYRPRKIYNYDPELGGQGLNPYTDYVTVPNIPAWTALNGQKHSSTFAR